MMKIPANQAVEAAFDPFPKIARAKLHAVRRLIFETARKTEGVGALEETLKWGQPSYLTPETKSGTTIRLGQPKGQDNAIAVFFHCQTDLVKTFRELYPNEFAFEGNRAVIMSASDTLPKDALRHCIALALTYHARKKSR